MSPRPAESLNFGHVRSPRLEIREVAMISLGNGRAQDFERVSLPRLRPD
jgi:hypothetical protein